MRRVNAAHAALGWVAVATRSAALGNDVPTDVAVAAMMDASVGATPEIVGARLSGRAGGSGSGRGVEGVGVASARQQRARKKEQARRSAALLHRLLKKADVDRAGKVAGERSAQVEQLYARVLREDESRVHNAKLFDNATDAQLLRAAQRKASLGRGGSVSKGAAAAHNEKPPVGAAVTAVATMLGDLRRPRGLHEFPDEDVETASSATAVDRRAPVGSADADEGERAEDCGDTEALAAAGGDEIAPELILDAVGERRGGDAPRLAAARSTVLASDLDAIEAEFQGAVEAERASAPSQPSGVFTAPTVAKREQDATEAAIQNFRSTLAKERELLRRSATTPIDDGADSGLLTPYEVRLAIAQRMNEQRRDALQRTIDTAGATLVDPDDVPLYASRCTPEAERLQRADFEDDAAFAEAQRKLVAAELTKARAAGYDLDDPQWHLGHTDFEVTPKQFWISRFRREEPRRSQHLRNEFHRRQLLRQASVHDGTSPPPPPGAPSARMSIALPAHRGAHRAAAHRDPGGDEESSGGTNSLRHDCDDDGLPAGESADGNVATQHFGGCDAEQERSNSGELPEATLSSGVGAQLAAALDALDRSEPGEYGESGSGDSEAAAASQQVFAFASSWRALELDRLHRHQQHVAAQLSSEERGVRRFDATKDEYVASSIATSVKARGALEVLGIGEELPSPAHAAALERRLSHPALDTTQAGRVPDAEAAYRPRYIHPDQWDNTAPTKEVAVASSYDAGVVPRRDVEAARLQLARLDAREAVIAMHKESPMDALRMRRTEHLLRRKMLQYFQRHPINRMISFDRVKIIAIADDTGESIPVPNDHSEEPVSLRDARQLAADLGLDLIQVKAVTDTKAVDRANLALCIIDDHRRHSRVALHLGAEITAAAPKTHHEVGFRGGTDPFHVRVKARFIAKYLYHGNPVTITMRDWGTPREGMLSFDQVLSEVRHQCEKTKAFHRADKVVWEANKISVLLHPSSERNPKTTVEHPTYAELQRGRDQRLVERERELEFDRTLEFNDLKEQRRYVMALQKGTAWAEEGDGYSMAKLRRLKRMLGYLPKGNREMYRMRGDVPDEMGFPFHFTHLTSVERISYPRESNLDQAERGTAVIAKRLHMPIAEMADTAETEGNPSTMARFYYRTQGNAWDVGELKTSVGLSRKGVKLPRLAKGFATLGVKDDDGLSPLSGRSRSAQ